MNDKKVIKLLQEKYPGKRIIINDKKNPDEVICEIEPTNEHPSYSIAVAVIDRTKAHKHKKATEIYKVLKGKLVLHINDRIKELSAGESYSINPGNIHWAKGNEVWVECTASPGWTSDDHYLINNE